MTQQPGDPAPEISAQNQDGKTISPDFEQPTVVYFYPEDATSGCTTQARQFVAEREIYEDAGVTVYGVSTDSVDSHRAFATDENLWYDLLADPDGEIAEAFGVELRGGYAARDTFVLADGEVKMAYEGVDPDGHAREVMQDLLDDGLVELPDL